MAKDMIKRGMIDDKLRRIASRLLDLCRAQGLLIATAESCTGGLVAAALPEIAGSSDVVDCGFVTYSNEAKQKMLGVPAATLSRHGAVLRDKVVVAADDEEIIVRCLGIIHGRERHALPFFVQIIGIVRRAIVQAEAGKLGIVVHVQKGLGPGGDNFRP